MGRTPRRPGKESYDEYAIDKLALMHRVDLEEKDKIHLLIGGVTQSSLRGIALSINASTVDSFMNHMRRITQGVAEQDKKTVAANATTKAKDGACRNCGKKGHGHKDCRGEVICFYCKEKGHRRFDCPLLKKDGPGRKPTAASALAAGVTEESPSTSQVAAGVSEEHPPESMIAAVQEGPRRLIVSDPLTAVDSIYIGAFCSRAT